MTPNQSSKNPRRSIDLSKYTFDYIHHPQKTRVSQFTNKDFLGCGLKLSTPNTKLFLERKERSTTCLIYDKVEFDKYREAMRNASGGEAKALVNKPTPLVTHTHTQLDTFCHKTGVIKSRGKAISKLFTRLGMRDSNPLNVARKALEGLKSLDREDSRQEVKSGRS